MFMVVVERGQKIYLLVLLHKDQVRLWLGLIDLTLLLDLLNIGRALSGQSMEVFLPHQ
jgi:hypothetical protein